jgi:hypothetical protein
MWWHWEWGTMVAVERRRHHGQFVHFLLALAGIYLAKTDITTAQQKIIITR